MANTASHIILVPSGMTIKRIVSGNLARGDRKTQQMVSGGL